MNNFNELTPAQTERLSILLEECGEVVQMCGKILRHGYASHNPNGGECNKVLLEKEIGDVKFALKMMARRGDIDFDRIDKEQYRKSVKVQKYLHYNQELARDIAIDHVSKHNGI